MWNIVQLTKQLASSHSLSLILTLSHPSQSITSFLSLILCSATRSRTRRWQSSSHHRFKRVWIFFLYDTAQPNLFWMNYSLCRSWGDRKCPISMNIFQHFSDFHKLQIILLQSSLLQMISLQDVYFKGCFWCDTVKVVKASYLIFKTFIFV